MHTRREEPIFKQLGDSFSAVAKIFFPNYEKSIIFVGCNKKKNLQPNDETLHTGGHACLISYAGVW